MVYKKWTFRCYCASEGARDLIQDWYSSATEEAQAELDNALDFLGQRDRSEWRRPQFDSLHRECKGLGEIRIKANSVQHRIIGFFGPQPATFTLLIHATEKDRKFNPKNACDVAQRRRSEVELNPARYSRVCTLK